MWHEALGSSGTRDSWERKNPFFPPPLPLCRNLLTIMTLIINPKP